MITQKEQIAQLFRENAAALTRIRKLELIINSSLVELRGFCQSNAATAYQTACVVGELDAKLEKTAHKVSIIISNKKK